MCVHEIIMIIVLPFLEALPSCVVNVTGPCTGVLRLTVGKQRPRFFPELTFCETFRPKF